MRELGLVVKGLQGADGSDDRVRQDDTPESPQPTHDLHPTNQAIRLDRDCSENPRALSVQPTTS